MTKSQHHGLKIAAAVALAFALGVGVVERIFAPGYLLLDDSPQIPAWVRWFNFGLGAFSSIAYIAIDVAEWWRHRFETSASRIE